MNRRTALAAAAAVSLSITGLAAAAGATMHVFDAAEASPNVGKVSPVSTPTLPPVVEHHVVVVDDPAPVSPAPAPAPGVAAIESHWSPGSAHSETTQDHATSASVPPPAPAAVTPAVTAPRAGEPEPDHAFRDD